MDNINSNFTNHEYSNIFNWFTDNSNHEKNIVDNFEKIISRKDEKKSFLDIGSGNGNICKSVSHFFENITLLEPNKDYINMYNEINYKSLVSLNFLDYETKLKYDVILCSHVLYHVLDNNWPKFIEKMYKMLNVNGICIIVHVSNNGEMHELRESINPGYNNSKKIVDIIKDLKYNLNIIPIDSILNTKEEDYNNFKFLIELFTIDDCFTKEKFDNLTFSEKNDIYDKINNYLSLLKCNNKYSTNFKSDMIIIKK